MGDSYEAEKTCRRKQQATISLTDLAIPWLFFTGRWLAIGKTDAWISNGCEFCSFKIKKLNKNLKMETPSIGNIHLNDLMSSKGMSPRKKLLSLGA